VSAIAEHDQMVNALKAETDLTRKDQLLKSLRENEASTKALKRELMGFRERD
jgi:hypothetical protein